MKRMICVTVGLVLLLSACLTAAAMGTNSAVQLVHVERGATFDTQITQYFGTLEEAVRSAQSGDVIEVFDNVTVSEPITIPADMELTIVSGTKRENTAIFGADAFEPTDKNAVTRTISKSFDGTLFTLGANSRVTLENIVLDGNGRGGVEGGLVRVGSGAALTAASAVIMKNTALGEGSRGGAVYVENGGHAALEGAAFANNRAADGDNVFAEEQADVTGYNAENPATAAPETAVTEPQATEPVTTEPTVTEPVTNEPAATEPATMWEGWVTSDETAAPDTGKADKSGCGSVLGASAALIVTAAAVTLVKRKHK